MNVEYSSVDQMKAAVKKWVMDLHDLDEGELNRAAEVSPDLGAFITRVKSMNSLNAMSMFDGLKLQMEFYTLVQATRGRAAPSGTPLSDLFLRTQPLFRYGIRTMKTVMNRASGLNFMGTGSPISKQASYRNNAAIWNAANPPSASAASAAEAHPNWPTAGEWMAARAAAEADWHPSVRSGFSYGGRHRGRRGTARRGRRSGRRSTARRGRRGTARR